LYASYSKEVDELINDLLDNFQFTDYDCYTAKLGGVVIWIGVDTVPFASMTIYNQTYNIRVLGRPSRLTIHRGLKKLKASIGRNLYTTKELSSIKKSQ